MEDSPRLAAIPAHPYLPVDAPLAHYAANESPVAVLLAVFGGIVLATVSTVVEGVRRRNPGLSTMDKLTVAWFALSYFIFNHGQLASLQTTFGQLWKEYSLSDSRYLTSDSFMLCVESFTVFIWGPLCWAIVVSIAERSRLRHPLTIIMCVGHLYGVALYYSTSLTEYYRNGVSHSRPEFLYFWVYYVGFNGPWVVVPALLLYQSVMHVKRKLESGEKAEQALSRIGGVVGNAAKSGEKFE